MEAALHWLWAEATKLANAHTVIDPQRNAPLAGIRAIRIAPFDATEVLQTYMHHVESIVGPERALKLLSTFNDHQFFGSFGRLEILAQIEERACPMVHYSRNDSNTGRRLGRGSKSIAGFEAQHGRLATPRADGPATSWKPLVWEPPASTKQRPMEVFGNDLLLTTVAIESIGITAEQSVPLQVRIDEWFKEMSALMGKHVS